MPVLLATMALALGSDSLHAALEQHSAELAAAVLGCVTADYVLFRRNPPAALSPDAETTTKKPAIVQKKKDGSLSESISITAGAAFAYFSYQVMLSSQNRIHYSESREKATSYIDRVAQLTPFQMTSFVGMALCLVVLVGCAGMSYDERHHDPLGKMSRTESWCVVALLLQAILISYMGSLHVYHAVFNYDNNGGVVFAESNVGLCFGLLFAGIGQVCVLSFHFARRELGLWRPGQRLQPGKPYDASASFVSQVFRHVAKPSSLAMIASYLVLTWVLKLMPESYYQEQASVDWFHVAVQLLVVDIFTYINHRAEHVLAPLYISSHKPHHRFTNPNVFDAFDGSVADTAVLILFPLFATSQVVNFANTWSYIAFGFVYSTHFMLIHSEWACPLDGLASKLGIYVAEDHHVHHSRFLYNYGHFFTFWDRYMGTYEEL